MKNPNVLIFITDQQSRWTISALGAKDIKTPNIDRIAKEGANFENFYTQTAVCTPSRATCLTGLYPMQHKTYDNCLVLPRTAVTFAEEMKDAGYQTGYAGKWHLNGEPKPGFMMPNESRGFDSCKYMYNRGHWKYMNEENDKIVVKSASSNNMTNMGDEKTYPTDFLTDRAIDFIKGRDKDKPFLYMVSVPDPHTPVAVREPYASMYKPENLHLPENFYTHCPEWMPNGQPSGGDVSNDREQALKFLADYLGEVSCIDDNVGKIYKALQDENILDDTILIFTTDHGEYMGEHGLWHKGDIYPSVSHLPFFIRYPKKIKSGTIVKEYASMLDFKKTILSLAGVENKSGDSGQDATKLLNGDNKNWNNTVYMNGIYYDWNHVSIIKNGMCLILRKKGGNLLLDLEKDPLNNNNLIFDNEYKKVVEDMYKDLLEHNKKLNSYAVGWLENIDTDLICSKELHHKAW